MNFATFKKLTRFKEALFGLPFIATACLLTTVRWQAIFIVPAFIAARVSGMTFNRFIDRHIDKKNPRTAHRMLPQGVVSKKTALIIAWGALLLFVIFSYFLNVLSLALLAAFLITIYSYTKRVTPLCHFVLGMIHFLAPIIAFKALSGSLSWPVLLIGIAAFFAVAGNDIVYATADLEFDQKEGLHSLPSKLGLKKSLLISKICHLCCVLTTVAFGISMQFPWIYYIAPSLILLIFIYLRKNLFKANAYVSLTLLIFTSLSLLWRAM